MSAFRPEDVRESREEQLTRSLLPNCGLQPRLEHDARAFEAAIVTNTATLLPSDHHADAHGVLAAEGAMQVVPLGLPGDRLGQLFELMVHKRMFPEGRIRGGYYSATRPELHPPFLGDTLIGCQSIHGLF